MFIIVFFTTRIILAFVTRKNKGIFWDFLGFFGIFWDFFVSHLLVIFTSIKKYEEYLHIFSY
jgi:hypothetical protein